MPKLSEIPVAEPIAAGDRLLGRIGSLDRLAKIGEAGGLARHDDLAADKISYTPVRTGIAFPSVQTAVRGRLNMKLDFGAVGDGVADDTAAIGEMRSYIDSLNTAGAALPRIVWTEGIYRFSAWPDLAFQYFEMVADGHVVLRYTGVGNAVTFDGTLRGLGGARDLLFDGFKLEAPSNAGNGFTFNAIHNSRIRTNVRGCGTASAAYNILHCVVSVFDVTASVNDGGWYNSGSGIAKPKYGVYIDRNANLNTSVGNLFPNPVIEGTEIGCYIDHGHSNKLIGGTLEACSDTGLQLTTNSTKNETHGIAYEANTNHDVFDSGLHNSFYAGYTFNVIRIGATARFSKVDGGEHQAILIDAGAADTSLLNLDYDGGITDNGTRTFRFNLQDRGGGNVYARPWGFTPIGDAAYAILRSDVVVGTSAVLTAPRTWTLPLANSVPKGVRLRVQDTAGGITATNTLSIARAGTNSINDSSVSFVLQSTGAVAEFVSDGVNNWNTERPSTKYRAVGDVNYVISAHDRAVGTNVAFTAPRTWTLPPASTYPAGQGLRIVDMIGTLTGTNTLTIQRDGADTIKGGTTHVLNAAFASALLVSNGVSRWHVL